MDTLSGKEAQEFIVWLHIASKVLPPKMTIQEAQAIFIRRQKEIEELKNETKN